MTTDAPATFVFNAIGTVRSPFRDTSQIPKGAGAQHHADGVLEVRADLESGLTDIEGFSHLYVIWVFHRSNGAVLYGPTPFDGLPHGVFATRSPHRPTPIGLTVVRLQRREGRYLHVQGVDMLDGTPLLDIKPYLSSVPVEEIRRGWMKDGA